MIATTDVLSYLIERRHFSESEVANKSIKITNIAQRNHNFLITDDDHSGFFLKQGSAEHNTGTVSNEAAMYRLLRSIAGKQLARFLPTLVDYDEDRLMLTLEALPCLEDLQRYHVDRNRFPKTIGRWMGQALGRLHSDTTGISTENVPHAHPSVLKIHRPPIDILRGISNVGLQLLQLVQNTNLGTHFERITANWRNESIIHCDVKMSNFAVYREHPLGRFRGLKLIDWEFAGIGDPRWDVGSVFSSYLHLWLSSVPVTNQAAPDELMHLAKFQLPRIQTMLKAFWASYCDTRQIAEGEREESLVVATECAAARLVQTAYEIAKGQNEMKTEIVTLTQTGLNIFERPEQAITDLLGIQ
jgi:Ser/Thr protein kinase RdoA (MazF antagonist)